MTELYPLKFVPILKDKIWGGPTLSKLYGKDQGELPNIGESWELSALSGDLSVVSNGFLAGNNIEEIIEVYMGDLTGDHIYEKYGDEFPLLIKLIEAKDDLSVQVHPGDAQAKEKHQAYGKTEMWYVLQSDKNAKIYTGFSRPVTRELYQDAVSHNSLPDLMNSEHPEPGDAFFTPAGRIHAIGAGIVLAEIQQTSDITYRIYDWDRKDKQGRLRELHTDLALEAVDYNASGKIVIRKDPVKNKPENLVSCDFFEVNIIDFNETVERDFGMLDSFVIYLCVEGEFRIRWEENSETITRGETVLIPAVISDFVLEPVEGAKTLEIYINNDKS